VPFEAFYPAEDYHQDYLKKNPGNAYIVINDLPKLKRLQKEFPTLYRPISFAASGLVWRSFQLKPRYFYRPVRDAVRIPTNKCVYAPSAAGLWVTKSREQISSVECKTNQS
jgi:hypothetical protein